MKWLKGKKTHIAAVLIGVQAVFSIVVGDMSIAYFLTSPELNQVLMAFGISFLRQGVSSGNATS